MKQDLKSFTIRIPMELASEIDALAAAEHRNRNGQIVLMLENELDRLRDEEVQPS